MAAELDDDDEDSRRAAVKLQPSAKQQLESSRCINFSPAVRRHSFAAKGGTSGGVANKSTSRPSARRDDWSPAANRNEMKRNGTHRHGRTQRSAQVREMLRRPLMADVRARRIAPRLDDTMVWRKLEERTSAPATGVGRQRATNWPLPLVADWLALGGGGGREIARRWPTGLATQVRLAERQSARSPN